MVALFDNPYNTLHNEKAENGNLHFGIVMAKVRYLKENLTLVNDLFQKNILVQIF